MKKSELRQLIREIIQEVLKPGERIDNVQLLKIGDVLEYNGEKRRFHSWSNSKYSSFIYLTKINSTTLRGEKVRASDCKFVERLV